MKIIGIHHVTLAVRDLNGATQTFARILGARSDRLDRIPAFGVRAADLSIGDSTLQLAAPDAPDNPLARFLDRKGEGFYNLALEVEDLDAAVRELQRAGILISEPVEVAPGVRSSFIAMAATHGLSIQLVQSSQAPAVTGQPSAVSSQPVDAQPSAIRDQGALPDTRASLDVASGPAAAADESATKVLDLTPDEWSDTE